MRNSVCEFLKSAGKMHTETQYKVKTTSSCKMFCMGVFLDNRRLIGETFEIHAQ
jgi:hypothetical protein